MVIVLQKELVRAASMVDKISIYHANTQQPEAALGAGDIEVDSLIGDPIPH